MKISKVVAAALPAADDDYLIGLANKGIVNRAKKDLAALGQPEITVDGDTVGMRIGDVRCSIKAPLGESVCSCPSSSMCRHRIAAILWLRERYEAEAKAETAGEPVKFDELRAYPVDALVKQLGRKRVSAVLFRHQSQAGPKIDETSVVTVEMPWSPANVRLLQPLEHSTCSCHSKTFCAHKAEALLYWLLEQKAVDPSALQVSQRENAFDIAEIQGVCRTVQEALTAQMVTGLSRMPVTVCESVERMAALCHTAKLPDLERALRGLHGEYAAYFSRSATFRDTALLQRVSYAFRLAAALEAADEAALPVLAGIFREDYEQVGNLELYLLGLRDFTSRSGYRGTAFYFWEYKKKRFYTFSNVRPDFYEGKSRRKGAATAPWNLPCTLQQAWNSKISLTNARATRTGNLSSTEQCQATLVGACPPADVFSGEYIDQDFEKLLRTRSDPGSPEIGRLAVVRPQRCEPQPFDAVRQIFSMRLTDSRGRDLWLEVRYNMLEEKVIETLDMLCDRIQKDPSLCPVFFGEVYREEDRLKLYPIEYFTQWEGHI